MLGDDEKLLAVYSHLVESYSHQLKDEWKLKVKVEDTGHHSDHSSIDSNTMFRNSFNSTTLNDEVKFSILQVNSVSKYLIHLNFRAPAIFAHPKFRSARK